MKTLLPLLPIFALLLFPPQALARVTPQDTANEQKSAYQEKMQTYSPQNQKRLEKAFQKITGLNQAKTKELLLIMERQGQILDEYIKRSGYEEDGGEDGINRNLTKPVENTRYWITYAHEAVAYQAAKSYFPSLTGEANLDRDIKNLISALQLELNSTRQKVITSQKQLRNLVKK